MSAQLVLLPELRQQCPLGLQQASAVWHSVTLYCGQSGLSGTWALEHGMWPEKGLRNSR